MNFYELTIEQQAAYLSELRKTAEEAETLRAEIKRIKTRSAWLEVGGDSEAFDTGLGQFVAEAAIADDNGDVSGFDFDKHPGLKRHIIKGETGPSHAPTKHEIISELNDFRNSSAPISKAC